MPDCITMFLDEFWLHFHFGSENMSFFFDCRHFNLTEEDSP